jgi:nitrilase
MLVAGAQLTPVFLDRDATVERAVAAIHEAADRGARALIVFPEAFVPGYPLWDVGRATGSRHG